MDYSDLLQEGHEIKFHNKLDDNGSSFALCRRKKVYFIVVRATSPTGFEEYCKLQTKTVRDLHAESKRFCMIFDFRQMGWDIKWKDTVVPFAQCHGGVSDVYENDLICSVLFVTNPSLASFLNTTMLLVHKPVRPVFFEDSSQPSLDNAVAKRVKENST